MNGDEYRQYLEDLRRQQVCEREMARWHGIDLDAYRKWEALLGEVQVRLAAVLHPEDA